MVKSKELEVLWKDPVEINTSLAAHAKVAAEMVGVLEEIKGMGVEPSQQILEDLFQSGELIKKKLSKSLDKEIADILPFRKKKAKEGFSEVLAAIDKIVSRVATRILKRDIPMNTIIDTSLFTWYPGKITVDEQSIIDRNSIFLENDGQKKILQMAKDLIQAMETFNREVIIASMSQARGIGRPDDREWNLIEIYSDYTFDIDYQAFKKIG